MKIGYDAKRLFLNQSGLGNYSRTLVQHIRQLDLDSSMYLFTPSAPKTDLTTAFTKGDYNIIRPKGMPRLFNGWWRTFRTGTISNRLNLDIYHGLSNELPHRTMKARSVVTVHDLIFLRYPDYYPLIDRTLYYRKLKAACSIADVIVAISEQTANDIVHFLEIDPERIRVIYQGCDPVFSLDIEPKQIEVTQRSRGLDRPYIISIGTIEQRKQQLALVQAYVESGIARDLDLVLIGRHRSYANRIREYLHHQPEASKVHFLYQVSQDALVKLLRGAQLMVYPSEFEGFGIPVLEAMVAGIPVIASNAPSLLEVGGDAPLYFDVAKGDNLGEMLKSTIQNPRALTEMAEKGLKRAKRFDNSLMSRQYLEVYRMLL